MYEINIHKKYKHTCTFLRIGFIPATCACVCECCACDSLPVGSASRCCLAGGSSVSHGVSWFIGVCPHLTPGASSSPGAWLSPGDSPETCSTVTHTTVPIRGLYGRGERRKTGGKKRKNVSHPSLSMFI